MVNEVPDDIFRSGVPHAVETNLVTRHAINPRHTFLETDPKAPSQSPERPAGPEASQATDDVASTTHSTNHAWQDNIQSLGKQAFVDNWQSVGKQAHTDNFQTLGKDHHQYNLQTIQRDAFQDNLQSLGASESIQETKVYFEKKSIKDNVQKVAETVMTRAAPQLPVASQAPVVNRAAVSKSAKPRLGKTMQRELPDKASPSSARAQEEDELRARMQKLKATVRDVNDTLSDLDTKP